MSDTKLANEVEASKKIGTNVDTSGLEKPDLSGITGESTNPDVVGEAGVKIDRPNYEQSPVTHEGIERSAGRSVATGSAKQTTGETNRSSKS
ncbi:hypothetical protein PYCC9005_001722 [Savitreella phatthalungensis]